MCFFNSQNKRALEIAIRYGRKTDIVEDEWEIIEEQKVQKAFLYSDCFIVTDNDHLRTAKWGLIPFWVRDEKTAESIRNMTANAKAETAASLPSFREAIKKRRCLIPSTGFYEYHHISTSPNNRIEKDAIPYKINVQDTEIFTLAGIYDEWKNPETKETVTTFTVLTVPASELCMKINNGGRNPGRMPVIIKIEDEEKWISPTLKDNDVKSLMQTFESSMMTAIALEKNYLRRN